MEQELYQILDGEGEVNETNREALPDDGFIVDTYKKMLSARLLDRKCVNLQRQGRIGTYVPFEGQEASQVGSAMVLEEGDWLFPTYRDHGAAFTFGQALETILMYWNGRYEGALPPDNRHIFPAAVPIASQLLHATGAAWAEKKKGSDRVSLVYFGDGATSEGDFHEGLNFASVFQAPVVFFNQNNGFAISVPTARQMHSKTIAQKAAAYDMEGIRVDGNDVLAVYAAVSKAVKKARNGGGPTLIESVTYRYGAHTTSDDPTKYRNTDDTNTWREKYDPVTRLEKYMKNNGLWTDELADFEEAFKEKVEEAVAKMEKAPKPDLNHLFDYIFETSPWTIAGQKAAYLESLGGDKA